MYNNSSSTQQQLVHYRRNACMTYNILLLADATEIMWLIIIHSFPSCFIIKANGHFPPGALSKPSQV